MSGNNGNGKHHPLTFDYRFAFANGKVKEFHIELDRENLRLHFPNKESYPEWTRLSHHQCENCPLKEKDTPYCPVAKNLVEVIEFFKDAVSHETAGVEITSENRTYYKETSLQDGISSLVGIVMVTSGCPVMDKLKPMVKTHLPFASGEETMYRAISMYLLAQYFTYKRGGTPDWDLNNLLKIYEGVRIVNKNFCQRLSGACAQDASLNAVIHLDCFADRTAFSLEEKQLDTFERFFDAYFNKPVE